MHVSLRTALVLFATTAVAAGACGGNVVVDTPTTGTTGIANGGAGPTTGTEPETTDTGFGTSVTGFGTTGTGFGGSNTTGGFGGSNVTTATGFGASNTTATGFGTTAVSVSSSTSVSVSSSTGTGAGGSGACTTDGSDIMVLSQPTIYGDMVQCAMQAPGNAGANTMCLEALTGLTSQCLSCVVSDLECSLAQCANPCIGNPDSEACISCRNGTCADNFRVCSGFFDAPGSTTCTDLLTAGTKGMGWRRGIPGEAFLGQGGFQSYQLIDQCACDQPSPCGGECGDNFCTLSVASAGCLMCLESACSSQMQKCAQN
jgi:hypothetical protein